MRIVSDGERAAVSGYRNQYGVGAALVLDALLKHDFEWVRVADPGAGRVDDLQIAQTARLDGYQIKWQQYPGSFTLNDLVRSRGANPPLIEQLADGWTRLRTQHPHRLIIVHLVTDAYASTSTSIVPVSAESPTPNHFAAFIEQAWKPTKFTDRISYQGTWGSVWRTLQISSGLDEEIFYNFVHDCELDFRTPAPPEDDDHRALADLLFAVAAGSERIVELDRSQLLERLGWRRRYEYRNPHEFDVPKFYRPITSTVNDLIERIGDLPGGYVGLIGPPGSGKSTLLTRTLRSFPIRLVRYYAYVPGSLDPNVRGESANFLHDITLRLEEAGVGRRSRRPDPSDRLSLLEKLHEQLQSLRVDYETTGRKTVILVDGLDHIAREQHPERSLLADLPLSDQIPEGVYFVLGSQTTILDDLPSMVRRELALPERCIKMDRLSPADVDFIAAEVVPELDGEGRRRLYELSAGHPLALIYTLKRLRLAEDEKTRAAILAEAIPYSDDIDAYYWSHWDRIQNDDALTHVLGLLARVRGSIGMVWAAQWIERPVALKLEHYFAPYFDIDAANRWSFFHNSFRLFLQARTAQPVLSQSSEEQERTFHAELAELYAVAEVPWRWEILYHRYYAGDHAGVVALATPDWFREQAWALRPMEAIQADVRLAIRSAGILLDSLALVRLMLVATALDQQGFILEDYPIADLLLDLGEVPQALELIRDGDALRVKEKHALSLSIRLAEMGIVREAAHIFELAEPFELLSKKPLSDRSGMWRDTRDLLEAWAEAAPRFRTPTDVLNIIEQLVVEPELHKDRSSEEATVNLQRWLGIRASVSCAERGAWLDWEKYIRWLDERKQGGLFEALLRSAETAVEVEPDRAGVILRELLERYEPIPLDGGDAYRIEARIDVAEIVHFLAGNEDVVTSWIRDLPTLPLQSKSSIGELGISQETRFRLYRLRYWLGEAQGPDHLVANDTKNTAWGSYTGDEEKASLRLLAFMVTTLAALWGRGRRGQQISPSTFLGEVRWILDVIRMPINRPTWLRLEVSASRPMVVEFLVQAAAEHGEAAVDALADEFVRRWDLGEWHVALRRVAVVAMARVGAQERARTLLTQIEGEMRGEGGPRDRAEEHWKQANAWLELGDTNAVRVELRRMITSSRGLLDDHDYQSEVWVRWMARANTMDPDNAEERIRTMLRRLAAVSGEAPGIRDAATELVAATFHWSPLRAACFMKGLQQRGVLTHEEALSSLLRAALEVQDPPLKIVLQAIIGLLIPFASLRAKGLVEALIECIAARYGRDDAVTVARYLVERVRAEAIAPDRQAWLKQITEGLNRIGVPYAYVGIEVSEIEDKEHKDSSSFDNETLYLNDGSRITLTEACQNIHSAADFQRLIEREDRKNTRYFRWVTVAETAADRMDSVNDVLGLAEIVESKLERREAAIVLARLSRRALDIGQADVAKDLALKAITLSEPVGWDRWFDGGSRIEAVEALQKVDPDEGRNVTIRLFAEDLGGPFRSYQRLLVHFDEILPLLFHDVPVRKVWELLEDYLAELYSSVPVEPVSDIEKGLSKPLGETSHDTAAQGVADAIAVYLDHPSYVVAAGAVRSSAAILKTGSEIEEMQRALISSAIRSDAAAERVLVVLEAVAIYKLGILHPFRELLGSLTESPNLAIRASAVKLENLMSEIPMPIPRLKRDIPGIYSLELPPLAIHRTEEAMEGIGTPLFLNDPARTLRPLDIEARIVANEAGVDEGAVIYRAVQFLTRLEQEHSWFTEQGRIDEGQLSSFLDNTNLRISFFKPHIEPAWRAVAHVAAELWDSGMLDIKSAHKIVAMLFHHDPSLILIEPQQRPSWIPTIGSLPENQWLHTLPDRWVERTDESIVFLRPRTPDGRIILGELSRFAYLGMDERIEEDRASHIIAAADAELWQEDEIERGLIPFHRVFNLPAIAYAKIHIPGKHLVIAHTSHGIHTAAAHWIAINPRIAHELGWQLSSDGLFRWLDERGDLAIESVWWRDGSMERHDRHQNCSIGDGWLVLATESGYRHLVERIQHLSRGGLIRRQRGFAASGGSAYSKALLPIA